MIIVMNRQGVLAVGEASKTIAFLIRSLDPLLFAELIALSNLQKLSQDDASIFGSKIDICRPARANFSR